MPVAEALDLGAAPEVGTYTPAPSGNGTASYIFHGGYHWLAEPFIGGGGIGSYVEGVTTAPGLYVHRMDSTGYSVAFPVELPVWFDWVDDLGGFAPGGPDFLCSWQHLIYRVGWEAGIPSGGGPVSCQFASDGTNLWLGVVAREEVPYPYYHSRYGFPYMTPPTLEALSAAGGYYAYQGSSPFCGGSGPGSWDDLGVTLSQRWHPASLYMYVWDGSGFAFVDKVGGLFETDYLESSTSDPGGRVGNVELAASPAEPGVCHALWGECGQYGRRVLNPPNGRTWPYRGTRLVYSKWSAAAKITETELMRFDIQDIAPDPPPDLPAMPFWTLAPDCRAIDTGGGSLVLYPFHGMTGEIAYTDYYAIRNDHGSPIIFLSKQLVWPQDAGNPSGDGATTAGGEPTLRAWAADATELQVLSPTLLPTPAENQYSWEISGGRTVDRLTGPGLGGASSRANVLGVSSRYTDPLLAGEGVYLFMAAWSALISGVIQPAGEGIYRIPCDGSAPFDLLDGDRNLAILPNVNHQQTFFSFVNSGPYIPVSDFFSTAKSVWAPSGGISRFGTAILSQLDRVCLKDWHFWSPSRREVASLRPPYYDPVAAKFYWADFFSGVAQSSIIRDICGATGLHLWHRSPDHR